MYTIFSDSTGRREALVLAVGDDRLRLAVRGSKDAIELESCRGRWTADGGEPVQIEFLTLELGWGVSKPLAMHATAGAHKQVA